MIKDFGQKQGYGILCPVEGYARERIKAMDILYALNLSASSVVSVNLDEGKWLK
jgi:hypothetical protein